MFSIAQAKSKFRVTRNVFYDKEFDIMTVLKTIGPFCTRVSGNSENALETACYEEQWYKSRFL